jgi:hypothetical protein
VRLSSRDLAAAVHVRQSLPAPREIVAGNQDACIYYIVPNRRSEVKRPNVNAERGSPRGRKLPLGMTGRNCHSLPVSTTFRLIPTPSVSRWQHPTLASTLRIHLDTIRTNNLGSVPSFPQSLYLMSTTFLLVSLPASSTKWTPAGSLVRSLSPCRRKVT